MPFLQCAPDGCSVRQAAVLPCQRLTPAQLQCLWRIFQVDDPQRVRVVILQRAHGGVLVGGPGLCIPGEACARNAGELICCDMAWLPSVQVGEFYEAMGTDAVVLVQWAGLNPMGSTHMPPRAGCPHMNIRRTLQSLVEEANLSVVRMAVPLGLCPLGIIVYVPQAGL